MRDSDNRRKHMKAHEFSFHPVHVKIDSTLLYGLDAFMTTQEQQFLASLMILGDIDKLAAATEMTHYISLMSLQGRRPSVKCSKSCMRGCSMLDCIRESTHPPPNLKH